VCSLVRFCIIVNVHSRAILFTAVDRVEVVDVTVPAPGRGEVLVEAVYTTISPGTELRCLAGRQVGASFPFIPGYTMVGRIAARGPETTLPEGTRVAARGTDSADQPLAWGGHVAHAVVQEGAVIPIPDAVDLRDAALAKLASIAYRGVRVAGTRPHEQVALLGLGLIGQLAARLHRLAGARVVAADLRADRVAIARAAGVEALLLSIEGDGGGERGLAKSFARAMPGGADIVVDASGAPALLLEAIRLIRTKPWTDELTEPARVVIQGSYPETATFNYEDAFTRELTIHFPRDSQPRDHRAVLRLLAESRVTFKDLLSGVHPPDDAAAVYAALRAGQTGLITAAFQWRQEDR
jgi:3-hydroxyethyl bacteriochlorophyllide a dehydrogenase